MRASIYSAAKLFRGHVAWSARRSADFRQLHRGACLSGGDARKAEVENLDVPVRAADDVLRFEIAVDDASLVGGAKTGRDIGERVEQN